MYSGECENLVYCRFTIKENVCVISTLSTLRGTLNVTQSECWFLYISMCKLENASLCLHPHGNLSLS